MNLINEGHTFWGIIMVSLPFTPVAIVGLYPLGYALGTAVVFGGGLAGLVISKAQLDCCWLVGFVVGFPCGCLLGAVPLCLALGFGLAFYIPGVIVCTALYLLFVLGSGCIKALRPDIETLDNDDKVLCCVKPGSLNRTTATLRTAEVATESYPQSILGE